MSATYRDISLERCARAAACVERHVDELRAILTAEGLTFRIVEGSAVSAEVFLAETNTLHTAVRVGVFIVTQERDAIDRALRRRGFQPAEPAGDMTLLRMAARGGRRAIHVLFGDDRGRRRSRAEVHPGDPAAVRERAIRLGSALLDLSGAYRRVRHDRREEHDVTESFEIQLIERQAMR